MVGLSWTGTGTGTRTHPHPHLPHSPSMVCACLVPRDTTPCHMPAFCPSQPATLPATPPVPYPMPSYPLSPHALPFAFFLQPVSLSHPLLAFLPFYHLCPRPHSPTLPFPFHSTFLALPHLALCPGRCFLWPCHLQHCAHMGLVLASHPTPFPFLPPHIPHTYPTTSLLPPIAMYFACFLLTCTSSCLLGHFARHTFPFPTILFHYTPVGRDCPATHVVSFSHLWTGWLFVAAFFLPFTSSLLLLVGMVWLC